jgi:hypothetical protein
VSRGGQVPKYRKSLPLSHQIHIGEPGRQDGHADSVNYGVGPGQVCGTVATRHVVMLWFPAARPLISCLRFQESDRPFGEPPQGGTWPPVGAWGQQWAMVGRRRVVIEKRPSRCWRVDVK